ncbi:Isoleucine--tRNA ligase, mitochondrial [Pseudolycoriella hygida]|uniref:isoleucine--tRNA ligase n=1 Tax=Pseudolycoriella hygida TaxID=35572 RepID=A0A9Q0MWP2_9DIPT|nr:Isoleucine--tRNA ligase, mitochondrial [Pseudolycoriella hygida]
MLEKIRCLKIAKNQLSFLRLSSNVAANVAVKYTDTINLPKTQFPQRLSATKRAEVERKINENCFKNLYQWQRQNLNGEEFSLHDGPPYANGDLHMGHAVNKIFKDIVLRENIINGRKVHYVPGWDCHGLPIELKAMENENKSDPLTIRQKARNFALKTLDNQKVEFASWGITADWNNPKTIYRTLDPPYIQNQMKIFYELYERNLIYRDLKPVYWSPSSGTALAEAELEYDPNFKAVTLFVRVKMLKYPKAIETTENVYSLIWTTTPWSIPSNQLICYQPDLEYCAVKLTDKDGLYIIAKSLIGDVPNVDQVAFTFSGSELNDCSYFHPIDVDKVMLMKPGKHVLANKGTGLVHIAPAHGPEDFLLGLEHKIAPISYVDDKGNYTADAPEFLRFKSVLQDGSNLVQKHLAENVVSSSTTSINYPLDWRTKQPIIVRTSKQWFINTDRIKEPALAAIAKVSIYPKTQSEANRNNLLNQLRKRPYWCISRQRVWGTPIPVFYDKDSGKEIVNTDIIDHLCATLEAEGNMDFWWTKSVSQIIPAQIWAKHNIDPDGVVKGEDILDIWFDSGISWMSVLNPPQVADLYLEGVDQFTGWFQSSLMTSVALRGYAPFKSLFSHGFTVDKNGRKMSKSLGNVILPKDITQKYGTDILRWWVAAHGTQHSSIIVSDNLLDNSQKAIQKIRAVLKFLVGSVETERNVNDLNFDTSNLFHVDKYFLNSLVELNEEVTLSYKSHQYNHTTTAVVNFVTNQLSAEYLHTIKDRFYCGTKEQREDVRNVLRSAFYVLSKILWPITPYLVEECWSYHDKNPFYQYKVDIPAHWKDPKCKVLWNVCVHCKELLHQVVPYDNTWTQEINISAPMETLMRLQHLHHELSEPLESSELCEILQVSSITLEPNENRDDVIMSACTIETSLCPRCRRFAIQRYQTLCQRCADVLKENE